MTRIFWTTEEKQAVAVRAFEIKNYASFDDSDIEAIRQAMAECLPDEKQRKLHTMSEVLWAYDYWDELQNPQKLANGRTWVSGNGNTPAKPQAIQPVVNPQIEREVIPLISIKDVSVLELWTELGGRINQLMSGEHLKKLVQQEVNTVLERRIPGLLPVDELQSPVIQPQAEERKKKIKVCVIGLLNGQQELVKREYKDSVDFLFFDKTPSFSKVQQTAQHYGWVIQMIKYSDQIKGANQISNFRMLGGLLTQLREFLNRNI
jgi:hypothetical protein